MLPNRTVKPLEMLNLEMRSTGSQRFQRKRLRRCEIDVYAHVGVSLTDRASAAATSSLTIQGSSARSPPTSCMRLLGGATQCTCCLTLESRFPLRQQTPALAWLTKIKPPRNNHGVLRAGHEFC